MNRRVSTKVRVKRLLGRLISTLKSCHASYLEESERDGFRAIGENVTLTGCGFDSRDRIILGNHIYIGPGTSLHGLGGITIEDYTIIAPQVVILSSHHNYDWKRSTMVPYDDIEILKPVIVRRACWIGMRTIIMPGVELGEGCIVGAGSVVTKSCPPGTILAGSPAKQIGHRDMIHFQQCSDNSRFYTLQKDMHGFRKVEEMAEYKTERRDRDINNED